MRRSIAVRQFLPGSSASFSTELAYTGGETITMDITFGPWSAEKNISKDASASLLAAMDDEARRVAKKTSGVTVREPQRGEVKAPGFSISGRLVALKTEGRSNTVVAKFTVWLDGFMANVAPTEGRATASGGGFGAEDALRSVTETKVKSLLAAITAGRVVRQG